MNNKLLWILAAGLVLALGGSYATNSEPSPKSSPPVLATATPYATVSYDGVDGQNALTLLKKSHQVETKTYDFGELVEVIDGQKSDATRYWILYVDGAMSQVGADALQTKQGQKLEWRLEAAR